MSGTETGREIVIKITVRPSRSLPILPGQEFVASAAAGLAFGVGASDEEAVIDCLVNIADRWGEISTDEDRLGKALREELAEMRRLLNAD